MVIDCLLAFRKMPIGYREVLEYMHGYLAAYPLSFRPDKTGQQYIVADRNSYRLGESSDLTMTEEMVKGENEVFTNTMQRKTFGRLIAMFANPPSPEENRKPRAIFSDQAARKSGSKG
jgi:hypothetical protein